MANKLYLAVTVSIIQANTDIYRIYISHKTQYFIIYIRFELMWMFVKYG